MQSCLTTKKFAPIAIGEDLALSTQLDGAVTHERGQGQLGTRPSSTWRLKPRDAMPERLPAQSQTENLEWMPQAAVKYQYPVLAARMDETHVRRWGCMI